LTHARVIDGTGAASRADQTLVISHGQIVALGPAETTKPPADAKVLDLTGRSVIPGLVGMHDHMYYPSPGGSLPLYPEHASSFPRLYLAGGVTSVRTTGSVEPYADLEMKLAIDEGKMAGPKVHVTGPYLEGQNSFAIQMHQLTDTEDARRTVEYWIAEGVTSNDLAVNSRGEIYFSDPPNKQVWFIDARGNKRVVHQGIPFPNGIRFSPDHAFLMVADTLSRWIWSFSVVPSTVVATRMVATFSAPPRSRIPRKVTRIANTEGIIAISRAEGLRKTTRKAAKISAAVRLKLSVNVGTRLAPTLA